MRSDWKVTTNESRYAASGRTQSSGTGATLTVMSLVTAESSAEAQSGSAIQRISLRRGEGPTSVSWAGLCGAVRKIAAAQSAAKTTNAADHVIDCARVPSAGSRIAG